MGPQCSPLNDELGLGVMDMSGRVIDTTHDAGYLECKNLRKRREADNEYNYDYNYEETPSIQRGMVPIMPDDGDEYEYVEARSNVPISPGETADELDLICSEDPKQC